MVWQILPPHWAATAAGGCVWRARRRLQRAGCLSKRHRKSQAARAYPQCRERGVVYLLVARLGRRAAARRQCLVNGSFSLGNVVYGTKSALQSIVGRPVLRNVAEHLAGPGYVFGSLLYTAQNLHSPLAATAGALFTVGSAEFWVSAARTDLLNRRAVPRTASRSTPAQSPTRDGRSPIASRLA